MLPDPSYSMTHVPRRLINDCHLISGPITKKETVPGPPESREPPSFLPSCSWIFCFWCCLKALFA